VQAAYTFGKLYLLPVKKNELPADIRMQPTW
jgi:magnesium-protoporphyrin IX monomethyl ester (oxidative) cyclase